MIVKNYKKEEYYDKFAVGVFIGGLCVLFVYVIFSVILYKKSGISMIDFIGYEITNIMVVFLTVIVLIFMFGFASLLIHHSSMVKNQNNLTDTEKNMLKELEKLNYNCHHTTEFFGTIQLKINDVIIVKRKIKEINDYFILRKRK